MYLLRGPGQGETAPLAFERPENALRVQLLQDAPQVRVGKTEFPRKLLAGHPPGVIAGDVKNFVSIKLIIGNEKDKNLLIKRL